MSTPYRTAHALPLASLLITLLGVTACNNSTDNPDTTGDPAPPDTSSYTIGGTTQGLSNPTLELNLNGDETLEVLGGTFEFSTSVPNGDDYNVSIAQDPAGQLCSVSDASGNVSSADVDDIEVLCRQWVQSNDHVGPINSAWLALAANASGDAVAINPHDDNIVGSRLVNGTWQQSEPVQNETGRAGDPAVAVGSSGNAIAIWRGIDSNSLYANRFSVADNTWGDTDVQIEHGSGSARDPQVAIDSDGNAIAVWADEGNVYANRLSLADNTSTWGGVELIQSGTGEALYPQIAIDPLGNAMVAWQQDGTISASRSVGPDDWETSELNPSFSGNGRSPQIGVDAAGNAVAVWEQSIPEQVIHAARFSVNTGTWDTPEPITAENGAETRPQIAVDPSGKAMAIWQQGDPRDGGPIYANRFHEGVWQTPERINASDRAGRAPQIGVDESGNAIAVWLRPGGGMGPDGDPNASYANRFSVANDAWGDPEKIKHTTESSENPLVAVSSSGNAVAVWPVLRADVLEANQFR